MSRLSANRSCARCRVTPHTRFAPIVIGWSIIVAGGMTGGCEAIHRPVASVTPPGLNWLTSLVPTSTPVPPPVVLESIKPATTTSTFTTGDQLEVTVWDLQELGKPEVISCSVDADGMISLPLYGRLPVDELPQEELGDHIAEAYRTAEILIEPRVSTRDLKRATIPVAVMGAVNQPGSIDLKKNEASVYMALVSAGGLAKNAGTEVQLQRRQPDLGIPNKTDSERSTRTPELHANLTTVKPVVLTSPDEANSGISGDLDGNPESLAAKTQNADKTDVSPAERSAQRFASLLGGDLLESVSASVSAATASEQDSEPVSVPSPTDTRAGDLLASVHTRGTIDWYDLSNPVHQRQLQEIRLRPGDVVTVKTMARTVRVSGAVVRPGSYTLPSGNALSIWEGALLAGGLTESRAVHVTLARPASNDQEAQRWAFTLEPGQALGINMPFVQPGDQLHFETTARSRFDQVLEEWNLWSRRDQAEPESR